MASTRPGNWLPSRPRRSAIVGQRRSASMSRTRASGAWPRAPARLSAVVVLPSEALGLPIAKIEWPADPVKLLDRVPERPDTAPRRTRRDRPGSPGARRSRPAQSTAAAGRRDGGAGCGGDARGIGSAHRPGHRSGARSRTRALSRQAAARSSRPPPRPQPARRGRWRAGRPLVLSSVPVALGLLQGLEEHAHRITRSRARRASRGIDPRSGRA